MTHADPLGDIASLLRQLFEIVGHSAKESELYTDKILRNILELALQMQTIQVANKTALQSALQEKTVTLDHVVHAILEQTSMEDFQKTLRAASTAVMGTYFQEILPSLSTSQKQQISTLLIQSAKQLYE